MKIKTDNYVCSICGKRNVKLWRPYMGTEPLICAECAEKRQSPREYREEVWETNKQLKSCTLTITSHPLPNWKVNKKGKIPTAVGPVSDGRPLPMTDKLLVDLSDVSTAYPGKTSMIPACPDEEGFFWGYTSVPEKNRKWWEKLPTR